MFDNEHMLVALRQEHGKNELVVVLLDGYQNDLKTLKNINLKQRKNNFF